MIKLCLRESRKKNDLLRKLTSSRMVQRSKLEGRSRTNPATKPEAICSFRRAILPTSKTKVNSPAFKYLELVSRYHISVDQILYGNEAADKSTERRQFEILLDELTDAEIKILTATAQAILDARADSEGEN